MTVHENFKNGKLIKRKINHVLKLVKVDLGSLEGCWFWWQHFQKQCEKLHSYSLKMEFEINSLLELYQISKEMVGYYQVIFQKNAKDLFEFFYDETATQKNGYYWFHFSIDPEEFRKNRVPQEQVLVAMFDPIGNAKELCQMMRKNNRIFSRMVKNQRR